MTTQELTNAKYSFLRHFSEDTLLKLWAEMHNRNSYYDMAEDKHYFFNDINDFVHAINRELDRREHERLAEIKRREKERQNNRRNKKAA